MRIILLIAATLALLAAAYLFNQALFHTWAATGTATVDPNVHGKSAGRFFGFCFLLLSAAVGLIVMAVRAGKARA